MAAITTLAAGDWSATGTWTGGVVPGAGDTVTLNHAVTLTDARTIGVSPAAGAATNAIRCNATLTIAGTGVLTCRGDIGLDTGGLVLLEGATLEFDAHLATTPSTALYKCGSINVNAGAGVVTIAGAVGARCIVRSNAGGAHGRFSNSEDAPFSAVYCDFASIGDSSNPFFFGMPEHAGATWNMDHCTLDANCGKIGDKFGAAQAAAGAHITLTNVTHRGTGSNIEIVATAPTTGLRIMTGCVWFGDVGLYRCDGFVTDDTIFQGNIDTTGGPWTSFGAKIPNMLVFNTTLAGTGIVMNGDCTGNVILFTGTPTNPHGIATVDGPATLNYTDNVFDGPDMTDGAGDMITVGSASAPQLINVKRNLYLPNALGDNVGTVVSFLGNANTSLVAEHNTYCSGQGVYVAETYNGFANMVKYLRSNIAWNNTANSAYVLLGDAGGTPATDIVSSANANHNGKYHPAASGTGYSANLTFSSGSPGANDITGDPQFVAPTRNFKTWDTANGGAGTVANALAEMAKRNDASGFNPAYTTKKFYEYVRAGFVVRNPSMLIGAHDGTAMGAVQTISAPVRRVMAPQQRQAA